MFGSEFLDVALGLTFVFLLVSLLVSAVREAIESVVKARAAYLERGIRELLGDPEGNGLAAMFYRHPLIYSLFRGPYKYKPKRIMGGGLPTYIPAKNFAQAIMDMSMRGAVHSEYVVSQVNPQLTVAALRESVGRLRSPAVQRAVLTALDHAGGDIERARENLQAWFDSSMDRVLGVVQTRHLTHYWLMGIGLVLAALLNINAVQIGRTLWRDKALRQAIATRAEAVARDPAYQKLLLDSVSFRAEDSKRISADLASLDLPIGWPDSLKKVAVASSSAGAVAFTKFWSVVLLGWIITALAVTLGAPFWFDALNKIMVIRSTVKPHEKSPEESSEDRQKGENKVEEKGGTGGVPGAPGGEVVPEKPKDVGTKPVIVIDRDHVPHEWAIGEPDEGVI